MSFASGGALLTVPIGDHPSVQLANESARCVFEEKRQDCMRKACGTGNQQPNCKCPGGAQVLTIRLADRCGMVREKFR